jgi:hypothetical protein
LPHTLREEFSFGFGNVKTSAFQLANPSSRIMAIRVRKDRRISVIVRHEILYAQTQLMQVADTLNLLRSFFGLRN